MNEFEINLNNILVETFNHVLKFEESSLKKVLDVPITITEAHTIEAIGKEAGCEITVGKLASVLGITMPSATIAIKKLENKGFVMKTPCNTDARRVIISLTDMGKKVEKVHRMFHERMARNISKQFGEAEKDVLIRAMNTLNVFFKEKAET